MRFRKLITLCPNEKKIGRFPDILPRMYFLSHIAQLDDQHKKKIQSHRVNLVDGGFIKSDTLLRMVWHVQQPLLFKINEQSIFVPEIRPIRKVKTMTRHTPEEKDQTIVITSITSILSNGCEK